ncbi:MAG: transporter [Caulobacteraceae bacterium]|nr:transporter [Caulobacteraceae bacterium]
MVDPVRRDLRITDTQISLAQGAAFAIFYVVAGLPLGRAVDVFPRRYVLIFGVLTWSAATLASGLAVSFGQLFVARIFVGAGESALMPAACALLADVFPPSRRGTAIGVFLLGASLGGGAGNLIGGILLQLVAAHAFGVPGLAGLAPWRLVMVLVSGPGVAVSLLLLTLREPERERRGAVARVSLSRVVASFRSRGAMLAPTYAALAFTAMSSIALVAWGPALLSRRMGEPAGEIGATIGAIGIAVGIAGSLGGGLLGDWVTRWRGPPARMAMAAAVSLIAIPGALTAFATQPWQVYLMIGLTYFATSVTGAASVTAIQDICSDEIRGLASAAIAIPTTLVGVGLGPTLVALTTEHLLHDHAAVGQALTIVAAPTALLATLSLWLSFRAMAAGKLDQ